MLQHISTAAEDKIGETSSIGIELKKILGNLGKRFKNLNFKVVQRWDIVSENPTDFHVKARGDVIVDKCRA